mgnify:CR=1 FL=1
MRKILVSLDITEPVADEAAEWGADLIVAHHPVIFHPVKRLTDETPTPDLLALAERGIAAICAHTNLDAAQGGVNVCLAQALELTDLEQLHQDWEGTLSSGAETLDFYRTVKEQCPETVFHGTDVGHQYDSTGARYGLSGGAGPDGYGGLPPDPGAIEQGQSFYRAEDDAYRENTMADNFIREFDAWTGRASWASTAEPTLPWMAWI